MGGSEIFDIEKEKFYSYGSEESSLDCLRRQDVTRDEIDELKAAHHEDNI